MTAVESAQTKTNGLKQPNHLLLSNQGWVVAERLGWVSLNPALSVPTMFWLLSKR